MKIKYQIIANKIIISLFVSTVLFGCKKEMTFSDQPSYIEFTESEMIIDVTTETKTVRIEVEATPEYSEYPSVRVDTVKTSAKHNFHFINTVDVMAGNSLGKFTPILGTKKSYRDIVIIPENIKDRVVITYTIGSNFIDENEPENLIKELTVILQPKSDE